MRRFIIFLQFIDDFFLEICYVDFVFYGAYGLVTEYQCGLKITFGYYTSKFVALLLLSKCSLKTVELIYLSIWNPNTLSKFDRTLVAEGIKQSSFKKSKFSRALNPLFRLKIVALLIIIALFQTMPFMSLSALLAVQISSTFLLGYITWREIQFESWINFINFWLIEITISSFLLVCLYLYLYEWLLCNFSGQSLTNKMAVTFQNVIAGLLALTIFFEMLLFFYTVSNQIYAKLSRSNSNLKILEKKNIVHDTKTSGREKVPLDKRVKVRNNHHRIHSSKWFSNNTNKKKSLIKKKASRLWTKEKESLERKKIGIRLNDAKCHRNRSSRLRELLRQQED